MRSPIFSQTITSDVPTNNGIRYISVRITNIDGLSKEFIVKQYPLEYIVGVRGIYSYREDITIPSSFGENVARIQGVSGQSYETISSGQVVDMDFVLNSYMMFGGTTYRGYRYYNYDESVYNEGDATITLTDAQGKFYCKYFNGTEIMKLSYQYLGYDNWDLWNSTWYEYYRLTETEVNEGEMVTNNNMYFVRITNTSDSYQLSVPKLGTDGYTYDSEENALLVSPAFMLASQLGSVLSMSHKSAKEHCKQYVEVSTDGTIYDDWRLPTRAELDVIDTYQNTPGSVIDVVLAGKYYWAADNFFTTDSGTGGTQGEAYIRCIRDVKPDEPIMNED